MGTINLIIQAVDNDGNNILHLAAHMSKEKSSSLNPYIRLSRELRWFKVNMFLFLFNYFTTSLIYISLSCVIYYFSHIDCIQIHFKIFKKNL